MTSLRPNENVNNSNINNNVNTETNNEIIAEADCQELNYSEYIVFGYIRNINIFTPNDIKHLLLLYYGKYRQNMYDSDWAATKIYICSWNTKSNQNILSNNLNAIIPRGYHLYIFGIKGNTGSNTAIIETISSILEYRGYTKIVLNDEKKYGIHEMVIYSGSNVFTGLLIKLVSKFVINKDNILCAILKIEQETVALISVNVASNTESINRNKTVQTLESFGFDWTCHDIVCFGCFGNSLTQYKNLNLREPLNKLNESLFTERILYYSSSNTKLLSPETGSNMSSKTGYYHNYELISQSAICCGMKIVDPHNAYYAISADNLSSVGAVR